MSQKRVNLNEETYKKALRRAVADAIKTGVEKTVMDTNLRGFGFRVRLSEAADAEEPTNATWIYHRRHKDVRVRETLGEVGRTTKEKEKIGLGLVDARAMASKLAASHLNKQILEEKRKEADEKAKAKTKPLIEATIPEICDLYVKSIYFLSLKPKTINDIKSKIKLYYKVKFKNRSLASIKKAELIEWKSEIKPVSESQKHNPGTKTGENAIQYLSGIISWYIAYNELDFPNPCHEWSNKLVPKKRKKKSTRAISTDDNLLGDIGNAFREIYNNCYVAACDILLLELLTGGRRDEYESALCEYVHLYDDYGYIIFPDDTAKNDETLDERRTIYLGTFARSIVAKNIINKNKNEKIFSAFNGGGGKITIDNTWDKFRKIIGKSKFHLHDFRHLFSAVAKNLDIIDETRERLMGHAFGNKMTEIYGRAAKTVLREKIEKIEAKMFEGLGQIEPAPRVDLSDYYSVSEFMKKAKIGKTTVFKLIKDIPLEVFRVNNRTYIKKDQLRRV